MDGSINRKVVFVILWFAAVCPCSKSLSCPTALKTNIVRRHSNVLYIQNSVLNLLYGPRACCPRALLVLSDCDLSEGVFSCTARMRAGFEVYFSTTAECFAQLTHGGVPLSEWARGNPQWIIELQLRKQHTFIPTATYTDSHNYYFYSSVSRGE